MNKALKTKTNALKNNILAFRKKDTDLICDGIIKCFDDGNEKETRESMANFFQILTPVESAALFNYLTQYTPIKARHRLVELIRQEFNNARHPGKSQKKENLSLSRMTQEDLDSLIVENARKDQTIQGLKKELQELKQLIKTIQLSFEPDKDILEDLKTNAIQFWNNRSPDDPQNPLDYYQLHYKKFHTRMYQFILRKYDPALIKAMDGKIAYLRKKGENIRLCDHIPPKKEKTTRKISVVSEKMSFLEK